MSVNREEQRQLAPGNPDPLGASVRADGVNFCVFSKYAARVELLLFAGPDEPHAARVLDLDPARHRTHYYWHVFVPGAGHGQVYAWRVHGPFAPEHGHRFDGEKVLLDPYGLGVTGLEAYDRRAAAEPGDNCACALRSVVIDPQNYDWEGDEPLPAPAGREVVYELQVAGFTGSPGSGVAPKKRGTYAGLIEKIPYLQELGVTAVELLPIHHFDPQDAPAGLKNTWGYSSLSFFAPHAGFSSDRSPTGPIREFRDMVKALHRAGIRVILDVVYNHTAEGEPDGPTLCWRGFENSAYYILDEKDRARYADFTGCGNTVSANHSVARRMILDSLCYWVQEMHVDGFRFDLASALARGEDGRPMQNPPVLWAVESEPLLAGCTLVAEAWDAAGLYQVGSFTGDRYAVWNGPFRDDVRRFLRGDENGIENLMARIVGSPDLFTTAGHRPSHSVNYVTCHDGFSLWDLVSYDRKHNEANGEGNRDGSDNNLSWNCGTEGPTDDPQVLALRRRQVRNFLTLLMMAHGTPLLTMGDEILHTRRGNNNPWCQDNELNRLKWERTETEAEVLRFTRELIRFTRSLRILADDRFWTATSPEIRGEISWHGVRPGRPDWSPESRHLAYTLEHPSAPERVCVLLNAEAETTEFRLPPPGPDLSWRLVIDTSAPSPEDITSAGGLRRSVPDHLVLAPHTVVVLCANHPTP